MPTKILVVDDDPHIREVIGYTLEQAGMSVALAADGSQGIARFVIEPADLIVLDVGMPEMDGLEMCRRIRKSSEVPILFLSARDEEIDRIVGLELGGDDYVSKPFSPRELVARIRAILKRSDRGAAEPEAETLSQGALHLHPQRHSAVFANHEVRLTALEFAILRGFLARPGLVFSRQAIVDMAYDDNIHVSDRTIDSHVRNIRAKLAAVGCQNAVDTVHGVGFRLGTCEASG